MLLFVISGDINIIIRLGFLGKVLTDIKKEGDSQLGCFFLFI